MNKGALALIFFHFNHCPRPTSRWLAVRSLTVSGEEGRGLNERAYDNMIKYQWNGKCMLSLYFLCHARLIKCLNVSSICLFLHGSFSDCSERFLLANWTTRTESRKRIMKSITGQNGPHWDQNGSHLMQQGSLTCSMRGVICRGPWPWTRPSRAPSGHFSPGPGLAEQAGGWRWSRWRGWRWSWWRWRRWVYRKISKKMHLVTLG